MEITISVPDDVGREINSQHNRDYLELPELIRMLEKYRDSSKVSSAPIKQKGKWTEIAEKIHRESPLHGLSEEVNKSSRKIRENFAFGDSE